MKRARSGATRSRPLLADHLAWRRVGPETIVLDLARKRMFGLNATGGWLWHCLAEGRGWPDLDGDADRELERFLSELRELDLVGDGSGESDPSGAEDGAPGAADEGRPPHPWEPPTVVWSEPLTQVAGSCAFLPGQNLLCNQAPFS